MSRYVLGLSALYHDAAAALLKDGEIVAAAGEERFSRLKHDASLPVRAAQFCLASAGISIHDVEAVVYYEKPLLKFERLLVSHVTAFPKGLKAFRRMAMSWLTDKLWIRNNLVEGLDVDPDRLYFCDHHLSHAASAFYCAPVEEAAILTADGVGEWASTTFFRGDQRGITRLREVRFPHSIGLVYSAFTAFLGFQVNSGEYKVMGMAAYGQPRFEAEVRRILKPEEDGSFSVDLDYVSYHYSATDSFTARMVDLFGPPRFPGSPFDPNSPEGRHYADVAASVQKVTEDCMVGLANALHRETGLPDLCLAGGVALNGVANREILKRSPFERIHIQPAAGDAGGAIGCALWAWREVLGGTQRARLDRPGLGRAFSDGDIHGVLTDLNVKAEDLGEGLVPRVVDDLQAGRVVGWFQGRFEWGPRALGHRSILADPRRAEMVERINRKIKFREPFRPFAPSCAADAAARYFELPPGGEQPVDWMLMVAPVKEEARGLLPAITHVDGSARPQTVRREANPGYHALVTAFGEATGHPVILNTSFNLKDEPLVSTPIEALATFQRSDLDVLYLGSHRVTKESMRGGGAP